MKNTQLSIIKKLGISTKFLLGVFILAASTFIYTALAAPPGSPYNLGETLAPTCAPGETNCTVDTPQEGNAYLTDIAGITANQGDVIYFDGTNWTAMGAGVAGLWSENVNDIYFNTGNVGIGTSTPDTSRVLHVVGDAKIEGDLHMIGAITHDSPVVLKDGMALSDNAGVHRFHIELEQAGHHAGETTPAELYGAIAFETHAITNAYNMEIAFWDGDSARPLFILNEGGTNRASTFDRSLQIGKTLGAAAVDGDYTLFQNFNYIDGNTGSTGADLGVEDDIETKGSIFAQENILTEGELRLADSDASNYIAFQSPATVGTNVTWTLPSADGTNGQALTTNGSGTLSWTNGNSDITAVGSMTSGAAFADATADDDWLGLGAAAGRIEFDDQAPERLPAIFTPAVFL